MPKKPLSPVVLNFDQMPDSVLADINEACIVLGRSRASVNRHFAAGELTRVKIGNSVRIRVGNLRALMGITAGEVQV